MDERELMDCIANARADRGAPITHRELGRRIRTARQAAGLTQAKVARALDIHCSAVALIEKGYRIVQASEMVILARLFDRSLDSLLALDIPEPPGNTLGELIRNTRAARGYSTEEFARRLDISLDWLAGIEYDQEIPGPKLMKSLSVLLGIHVDQLIAFAGEAAMPRKDDTI